MTTIKTGDHVKIDTDNWADVGKTGKVLDIQEHKVIVLDEDGVTRTLSVNQVIKQRFLSE